ncbi:competence/damage-inducible protein A [Nitrospira moscoviensis]|uniref:CinA-like protein n=1 Tax=Nitrospira moscoviensis TaxID=42253 RepID=A0A0K2GDC1_NITMO|nr:competence/damage-inducible protein A [Nitrospira moscoviensis]ALA58938.1 putative competence-damage inducible protein [Nitrospira moscoviensis]
MPRRAHPDRSFTAETIAIGSELLIGGRSDSNSLHIAEALGALGIELRFKSIVGDDRADIMAAVKTAVARAAVVIMTGGLGPTVDDCTREAVAVVTGRRLARRKEALDGMQARLAQWGRSPNKGQLRQALIPSGAAVVPNPVGSAPGFWLTWTGAIIVALPGVPREMEAMLESSVVPLLRSRRQGAAGGPRPMARLVFHTWGLPEADVDAKLAGLVPARWNVDLGLLASPLGVLVSLTTNPRSRVLPDDLATLADGVRARLGEWLYAEGRETMEEVVGRLLAKRQLTVATAESCTGGLIGHRLTQVPGSSAYLDRGVICYSNRAKTELLGVPPALIETHGAVSAEVAAAMADGVRTRAGVSVGVSVTGIAGPGGATPTKPVGLVYIGLNAGDGTIITHEHRFHGDRSTIKQRASQAALDLLRRWALRREAG